MMYGGGSQTAGTVPSNDVALAEGTPPPDIVVPAGASIQSAVKSAKAGDVIGLAPGTYTEQVILNEEVTLVGASMELTTIRAPPSLSAQFARNETDYHPVIAIETDGAVVRNLTVDGDRQGAGNKTLVGVSSHNAHTQIVDAEIIGIISNREDRVQHGVGILAHDSDETEQLVQVERCMVRNYGTDGIVGVGTGLDLKVNDCAVIGRGPTGAVTQNGILVQETSRSTIVGNDVRANVCPSGTIAAGVLSLGSTDVFVAWNVIEDNDCAIAGDIAGDIVARGNNIQSNGVGAINRGVRIFDARNNWWGSSDGPSKSDIPADSDSGPEVGMGAIGPSDAVSDIRWEPYSRSPFHLRPSGQPLNNTRRLVADEGGHEEGDAK